MSNCELDAPTAPRFPDPTKPIQQVTQLPRNHVRAIAGHIVRRSQEIRLIGLLIAFGFAGGVTGGLLAVIDHQIQQNNVDNSSTLVADEATLPVTRPDPSPAIAAGGGRVPTAITLSRRARLKSYEFARPGDAFDQEDRRPRVVDFYGFRQGKFGRKAREKSGEDN